MLLVCSHKSFLQLYFGQLAVLCNFPLTTQKKKKRKKEKKRDSISNFRLTFLWIFYFRKPKLGFRLTPCKGTKIGPENIRGDVLSTIVGARYKGQCGLMGSSFHESSQPKAQNWAGIRRIRGLLSWNWIRG